MLKLSGKKPDNIGLVEGNLTRCSWKPNCACSQYEDDEAHYVPPLELGQSVESAWPKLVQLIQGDSAAEIKQLENFYIHAEYSTRLLGFVDDVEFLGFPGERVIHVRSASRLGIRDFGVNRRRIEKIRAELCCDT